MTAGPRLFDRFLGAEPPECRKAWHELDRIAVACGLRLDDLVARIRSGGGGMYGRARELCGELEQLGSLQRLYRLTDHDREMN